MSRDHAKDKLNLFKRCTNPELLRGWLEAFLLLRLPAKPVCPDHCSPFEYVRRAYFDQGDLVVWAPRGGGKTRLAAAVTLAEMLHKPGVAVRILGGSLEQSLKMWEHLHTDIETLLEKHDLDGKLGARSVRLANGSSAAAVPQSQRAVRGMRVQKLRCDEADMFHPEVWQAAQLVTRSIDDARGQPLVGSVEAISTYHRRAGVMKSVVSRAARHNLPVLKWCLMDVLQKCPAERACETCDLLEECRKRAKQHCDGFMSIDDAIAFKRRVSRDTWESEMMCMRPITQGAVFKHFNPDTHVVKELPPPKFGAQPKDSLQGLFLGLDFGYKNPFVCLWVRRDAYGRSFVIDEYVREERTIFEHIEEIRGRSHGEVKRLYCDPAGNGANDQTGRTNVEELRKHFLVRFKSSQIQDGIELIRAALCSGVRETSLFIHPNCKRLIEAMQDYRYKEEGGGENPQKDGNDHLTDALRYYFVNARVGELIGTFY